MGVDQDRCPDLAKFIILRAKLTKTLASTLALALTVNLMGDLTGRGGVYACYAVKRNCLFSRYILQTINDN